MRPACGAPCADDAPAFAGAVSSLLSSLLQRPEEQRRTAARTRAEEFAWPSAADGMLRGLHWLSV